MKKGTSDIAGASFAGEKRKVATMALDHAKRLLHKSFGSGAAGDGRGRYSKFGPSNAGATGASDSTRSLHAPWELDTKEEVGSGATSGTGVGSGLHEQEVAAFAEERELIGDVFRYYDIEDDGVIPLDMAIQAWRQFGYHFDPLTMRSRVNSSFVSEDVFCTVILEEKMNGMPEAFLSRMFGLMDRDGSGRISVVELRAFLKEHGVTDFNDQLLDDLVDEVERPLFGGAGFSCSDLVYFVGRTHT